MVKSLVVTLCMLAIVSCRSPAGDTPAEQVQSAIEMRDEAMAGFYAADPDLRAEVEQAEGYAVFSSFSIHPALISFASGYGVVTDNATQKVKHTRWLRLTLGPGIAVKGLYGLVIFHDRQPMEAFEEGCWTIFGQVEASFIFGDFGGSAAHGWLYDRKANARYMTHTGVALELEVVGIGRVMRNSGLDEAAAP